MYILAFDTATKTGSVAVTHEDQLIINYTIRSAVSHSKRLLSIIELVLRQVSLVLEDLSGFGVTIGPGSFTGLRIGLSVAKGLSYATGKPLVGASTLKAMAFGLPFVPYLICPVLDAKKGEIYVGFFKNQERTLLEILPEMVLPPRDLTQYIHEPIIFIGDGILLYRDLFRDELEEKTFFIEEGRTGSVAACVALMTFKKIKEGQIKDIGSIKPHYIRRSEAEIKWGGREKHFAGSGMRGGAHMWKEEDDLIEGLKRDNKEFCHLLQEHQYLEKKLEKLNKLHYLTPEEEMERKTIQKKKLFGKDRMAEIIRKYRAEKVQQD